MAHVEKFTKAAAGHMFKHYERAKDENGEYIKFANQSIDLSRTHLNYNLAPDRNMSQGDFVKKRCTQDGIRCMNRKDVNVMCSWIVTVPRTLPEEEHRRFFEEAYKFLTQRYSEDNVVSAHVHMDESQPHIHFAFVPVIADKKRGGLKVSAKELIGKKELLKFHPDLTKHMISAFGYDVGIENGATALGNQTVEQLKAGEELKKDLTNNIVKLKEETEFSEGYVEHLDKEIDEKSSKIEKLDEKHSEIESKISADSAKLEKIAKKKADIKAVENIEVKPTLIGNKVTVSADDFENLKTLANKQIASVKQTKKLKSDVAELTDKVQTLSAENADLKKKSEVSIKFKMEQDKLKQRVGYLENLLTKIMEFIEKLDLKKRLDLFLNPSERQRDKSKSNQQEI